MNLTRRKFLTAVSMPAAGVRDGARCASAN